MKIENLLQELDGIVPKNPKSDWSKYQRHIVDIAIKALEAEPKPPVISIPENLTNGDMIKAMFPNIESIDAPLMKIYVYVYTKDNKCMRFDSDWWHAPYKKG